MTAPTEPIYIIDKGTQSGSPIVGPFEGGIPEAKAWITRVCDAGNPNRADVDSFVIDTCVTPAEREREILG